MAESGLAITGADGQLGRALRARFPRARAAGRDSLDITDEAAVRAFDWDGVNVIVNAAAYTNVDGAETAEGRVAAWRVNVAAVAILARVAVERDLTLVSISSDYVWDGTKAPHREDEPLSPLGVYAQTKAAGDLVVSVVPKHYVVRVSWLVGDGPNFVRTMMGLASRNIAPRVVDDQVGRLTFTRTVLDAIEKLLGNQAAYGTYNVSNGGEPASWAEIARAVFTEVGRGDLTVSGVSTAEYSAGKTGLSPRPLVSVMELGKIERQGLQVRDWRMELKDYVTNELRA